MQRQTRQYAHDEKSAVLRKYTIPLAYNLQELRKRRWMTQEQLSVAAGVKQQLISELENGWANPKLFGLAKLADYHQVEIGDLFDYTSS